MNSGPWRFLTYIVLPQPAKMALLPRELRDQLDRINLASNVDVLGPWRDRIRCDPPVRRGGAPRVPGAAPGGGCLARPRIRTRARAGRRHWVLTRLIAARAQAVVAVEPVPEMQRVIRKGCQAHGIRKVETLAASAADLSDGVPPHSVDRAFVIQSLHHMRRRREVFEPTFSI